MAGPQLEMVCDSLEVLPPLPLCPGYTLRTYRDGDDDGWYALHLCSGSAPSLPQYNCPLRRVDSLCSSRTQPLTRRRPYRCACFAQWTSGPAESYTAAGWTPSKLQGWFAMEGGSGITHPENLFLVQCDADSSIAATACW